MDDVVYVSAHRRPVGDEGAERRTEGHLQQLRKTYRQRETSRKPTRHLLLHMDGNGVRRAARARWRRP